MRARLVSQAVIAILCPLAASAGAQSRPPTARVTLTGGYAGFVDDSWINHQVVGGGAEWVVTPRIAVGPELLYMIGPRVDRDLFVLGMARFGILPFSRRVVPVAIAGGGFMVHSDRFNGRTFRSAEGAFVFGGGARVGVTPNVYVTPELTMGWEPHVRASVNVGITLR
ncbi:MAG: hypothetical protein GEU82_00870 [Luteitalea sp.]|nr:hypothetical protein [Luteitalea sp.]